MDSKTFNSIMPHLHHIWAADVLNMDVNLQKGPDIIDEDKNVEIKFCLYPNPKNYVHWTAFEYQIEYCKEKPCFWGVGTYELSRPVSKIRSFSLRTLESYVKQRELYLVHWDWIYMFNDHISQGKTARSEWNNHFRYPRFNALPKVKRSYDVQKGHVHITEKVPDDLFDVKSV